MFCEVMMPSVDHCMSKSSEMTTLSNSLEMFDTYKNREDKDSDEESFHLPLDDEDSEPKYQETLKNGNETEEEILNKFDSTVANYEPIDSQLEERLLNDEEEERKSSINENGVDKIPELNSSSADNDSNNGEKVECADEKKEENDCDVKDNENPCTGEESSSKCTIQSEECSTELINDKGDIDNSDTQATDNTVSNDEAKGEAADDNKKIDNDEPEESSVAANINDKAVENNKVPKENIESPSDEGKSGVDSIIDESTDKKKLLSEIDSVLDSIDDKIIKDESKTEIADTLKENHLSENDTVDHCENSTGDKCDNSTVDKCENSNDSSKNQIDDSEDLFDISVIRDANEDNAESAYNEAHPEENDDYDERNDDKMEDDSNSDKANNLEEDEEEEDIDMDKHEDQLKHDNVDIEETNLTLECDNMKDAVSDFESDSGNRVAQIGQQVQNTNDSCYSAKQSETPCILDEVTGKLTGSESSFSGSNENSQDKRIDVNGEEKRKSLKRTISDESEGGITKKSRTELTLDSEIPVAEKPKEKLPLKNLLSFADFMKNKKSNKRLTMHDLEEFCVQKICEVIVHKSDMGDVHHQLKLQEQLIESMRKEIQQLTKQARDLEIVNKKLLNDLKQQNATQKPLNPLKITRSVGLQVKFTPAYDAYMKRKAAGLPIPKVPFQPPTRGAPRTIPSTTGPVVSRQVASPQKQQHTQPKPNTPLLSQALQQTTRRVAVNDVNKTPPQAIRPKAAEPKTASSSASVIDLTDEDDKRDKTKTISSSKVVPQKSITVPLRTTPVRVNTSQGIRLTTSQGKGSPITSVVTSSAPQVMYVVQSSPQNVLASTLGPKAVVVNFQSANGVLTSALNGSAVSVIPKQGNTIQLKAVTTPKGLPASSKVVKLPMKHPAPLPPPPVIRVNLDKPLKAIPPKPHLTIRKTDTGIILQWKMPYDLECYEVIASYQLYAYQETSAPPSTDMWRKVGDVKALALPMACTLTQFADKNKYYFAVRPVDIHKRIGVFSEPEEISL